MGQGLYTVIAFVSGALALSLLSIPARAIIDGDPFSGVGFIVASIIGGHASVIAFVIYRKNRLTLEKKIEDRTHELAETNVTLRREMEERMQAEDQIRQSHKMEAIGRLAGGVAHDINNVLTAIMTLASTIDLELRTGANAVRTDDIKDILDACKRGRELTLSLLGFARKGEYEKKPMLLSTAVDEVFKLLGRVIPKTVVIEKRFDSSLAQIHGDPGQIKNVLMNLCINAVDAMDGRGSLTITGENSHPDGLETSAKRYVRLQVVDTGTGMSEETVERAFDPFYTTKPEGKGTGLGLSRVYGIIKDHDGTVTIDTELGKGTTMTVILPALGPTEADPGIQVSAAPDQAAPSITVLLVDDEALIRKSVRRLLEQLGYQVILAENGEEAIHAFQEHRENISLVILDMIMPVMDGEEAFRQLRNIDPQIPVLICSGYSNEDEAKKLLTEDATGFVQKPFSPGALSTGLTTLLDEKPN